MTFMSNLAANPGGSGIYGQPAQSSDSDMLGIVNQLKDREMSDFKNKANFMADLSLKQDKMRALFDPNRLGLQDNKQPNVVLGQDPNEMTGEQKVNLGIRQQDLGIRKQGMDLENKKLDERSRLSQEGLDIKTQQEQLNQQKSDQIHAQKMSDMQRKIDESNQKIEASRQALESKNTNAEATLQAHKDMAAAIEVRHKLELSQKDAQFNKIRDQHQQTIDNLTTQLKQRGNQKTTTELNPDQSKRITTIQRGDAADIISVQGKDGKTYTIPKDKMNDMDSDGTPHWKPIEQDDQDQNDNEDQNDQGNQ